MRVFGLGKRLGNHTDDLAAGRERGIGHDRPSVRYRRLRRPRRIPRRRWRAPRRRRHARTPDRFRCSRREKTQIRFMVRAWSRRDAAACRWVLGRRRARVRARRARSRARDAVDVRLRYRDLRPDRRTTRSAACATASRQARIFAITGRRCWRCCGRSLRRRAARLPLQLCRPPRPCSARRCHRAGAAVRGAPARRRLGWVTLIYPPLLALGFRRVSRARALHSARPWRCARADRRTLVMVCASPRSARSACARMPR